MQIKSSNGLFQNFKSAPYVFWMDFFFFFFWMQEPTLGLNLDGVDGDKWDWLRELDSVFLGSVVVVSRI